MALSAKKEVSKLAVVSLVFIVLGFLAIPICNNVQHVMDRINPDYTRMEGYTLSIVLWGIALLPALIAVILISVKQPKTRGLRLP